jgi:hypothetical protein
MYAPRGWALKKRPLFIWGKYFVLRFPSLDCLVYFDPGRNRRERVPRGWAGLDDCNPDQIIRLVIGNQLLV